MSLDNIAAAARFEPELDRRTVNKTITCTVIDPARLTTTLARELRERRRFD